jgi:hypothetical protein
MIERASKIATAVSTLLIVALLLWFHPDIVPTLQVTGAAAFVIAWLAARRYSDYALAVCVLAAPVAPALLRLATAREQPVLDVVWMAGVGGALLGSVSWSRWTLPPIWRPLAGGWALALALAWPVLVAREIGFDFDGLRDWGAVVSWAFWPAPHAASWTLYWVLTQMIGLLWLDWIAARFLEQPDRIPRAGHALWIGATAASAVGVVQGTIDLTFLNPPFWASLERASGTMLEANGFGFSAAIAGPVAFLALRSIRPASPAWAWGVLAVNWTGVWMSGSRTALVCAVMGAAGLVVGLWRAAGEPVSRRHALVGAALLIPAAALVVLAADATGPLRRIAEIPLDRAGVADFWERGGYGSIAMQIVREYPLTGTGAGTFHYIAPDYWRASADDALAPDNAQNWWRHQAAELGIAGGALVLIWSAVLAWLVLAGRRAEPPAPGSGSRAGALGLATPTVRGLLVGLGLSSMVGVPTQNPVVLISFFLLVGWLGVLLETPRPFGTPSGQATRGLWILAAVLAVSYAGGHLLLARTSLSVASRASRFEREYVTGAYQPEALPDGGEFRWTDDESRFVLPVDAPWLVIRLWAAHPDIAEVPVGVALSTRCGVLWEETLRTRDPVTIRVLLPERLRSVDTTVDVARTWQPSGYGSDDQRDLGVGIAMDFVESLQAAGEQARTVRWPVCQSPGD